MYLRITQRRNRDGSTVAYYALAENAWNAAAKRSEAQIVHNFGRADQVDREGLKRLVDSINRVLDQDDAVTQGAQEIPQIELDRVASRRYGRYLTTDYLGRPRLDAAKVKAAEKFDGKFVVITNDDTLSAEDVALGYKGAWIIEACFRRMKQTGLEVRPMFHWTPRRIEAHVKLCVLALQMQRAAEIRCALPWAQIAHQLAALKAIRYHTAGRTIVQRTKIADGLGGTLKKLGVSMPKQILSVSDSAAEPAPT
jgi:transposase